MITLMSIIIFTVASVFVIRKLVPIKEDNKGMVIGGLWFNAILLVVFMFVLSGGG